MTLSAASNIIAASSVVDDFIFICLPEDLDASSGTPIAPNITFAKDLFIPLHIIFVRMRPEAPTNAPAMINPLFIRTNPVAEAATPEYELSSEMTTGISAPPIGMVNVIPIRAEMAMIA